MSSPIRLEFSIGSRWNQETNTLSPAQVCEIRLSDQDGKISRARKPAVRLVADSRQEILRQIADWIELREDPDLTQLADDYAAARG